MFYIISKIAFETVTTVNSSTSFYGIEIKDIILIGIGALIGLLSSICLTLIERLIDSFGKVKIYYKILGDSSLSNRWGFVSCDNHISLVMPMVLEIQNTKQTSKVLRNLNLSLYKGNKKIGDFHQTEIVKSTNSKNGINSNNYGNSKGSYSFIIESRSITRENCFFLYQIDKSNKTMHIFDRICLTYFNESDKLIVQEIKKINGNWDLNTYEPSSDWQVIKE